MAAGRARRLTHVVSADVSSSNTRMKNADHDAYARLRALFERCSDMAPGERDAWLEREAVDTTTRIELELMLAADANEVALLRRDVVDLIDRFEGPADEFDAAGLIGRRYGAFRLTRLIGSGGQGTVYEGMRVEGDFEQKVAVKLLRRGIHDPHEHRRFRRERDILARFDDPGIARLIDGGVSAEGVPYLIMDFVDGEPFDRWCARNTADTTARLALFERLCTIVAAAHRALIVHRDLKPANVLVCADGTVKVLDFGIARLLDEDDAQGRTAAPLMTPGYGAPEQRDGGPVTLATDVHALGVMLREVLTGRAPNKSGACVDNASAAHAGAMPAELAWITARATDAEPARRYRDAAALHDDIARYRSARPVHAHPPSTLYAARKFVRRHRGGVLATMLFLVGVLASAGVALWQASVARAQGARATAEAERAKIALDRAEAVRDFIVGVFETGGAGLPRDQLPDTATLLERGRSAALAGGLRSPETQVDMLSMLGRIYLGLQREDRALELVNEALAILQKQVPRNDEAYAVALARRGELHGRLGRGDDAGKDFDAALALQRARDPDGLGVARTLIARGEQRAANAEVAEGVRDYERALAIEAKHADAPTALRAQTLNGYGIALWRSGDCARGEEPLREAVALARQAWGDDHAETAGALSGLSLCLTQLLKFEESEAVSRESLAILVRIFGPAHPALGQSKNNLANLLIRVGKLGEAEPLLREKLAADHQTGVDEAGSGLNTWINLANLLRNRGDLDGAQEASLTAQRIGRRIAPDAAVGHEPELLLARLALAKADLAAAQSGVDAYRRWQATPQGAQAMLPARVDFLEARIALQRRDLATAAPLVERGLEAVEQLGCTDGARGYLIAADLRRAQDRDGEARALLDRAVALCERLGTPRHFACGEALLARAEWRLRQGDRNGAEGDAALADAAFASELPPTHADRSRLALLRNRLR
jgi:serine/threonine-protein kinase